MAKRDQTQPHPRKPMRVLTAAAQRMRADRRGKTPKPPTETWQVDAFDVVDQVPEVAQATTFIANVISGVRLFIAMKPDEADQEPQPAPDGVLGVAEARMTLDRIANGASGGLAGLLKAATENVKIAGEYWVLGEPEVAANPLGKTLEERLGRPERWSIKSIDEVKIKDRGVATIKDTPGDNGREVRFGSEADPDDERTVFLLRVWDRHPRFSALARSSLRAALLECDELLMLSRSIRSTARSRYAGAGILAISDSFSIPVDPNDGDSSQDPDADPFAARLHEAMIKPIGDEGLPEAVVPIVVQGPFEEVKDGIQHHRFLDKFDPEQRAIRAELRERLGSVLDLPIEQLTGIAKVNHWGAWQVDGATWARYGQPTTRLHVEAWTEGLLWAMLDAAGIDGVSARRLMIWFDPADAIMDPDESKTADELFDRAAISWEAYRQRKGAGEDEAPSEDELRLRAELGLLRGGGPSTNSGSPVPNDGEAPAGPDARARAATNGHRAVTAAARPAVPLGRRLMEIDRATRARLDEGAEAALRRALERAGARIRSAAQGDPNLSASLRTVPAHEIGSRVTTAVVAALGLTESEILADSIAAFGPRFDQRVRTAQRQVREALRREFDLDADELDSIERQQDRDRHDAWHWLSASLLLLATDRLYNPSPAAPAQGEVASSMVPPEMLRQAMTIAGGGDLGEGAPKGGIGLGRLVLDVFSKHGQVVGGWQWVHGEPERPFPAHEELDGAQFRTWDSDVLAVQAGDEWLGVTHYRPGDHAGCSCDFIPLAPGELDDVADEEAMVDA